MADQDATRPPGHADPRSRFLTPESRSRNSYETGESSRTGTWREGASSPLPTYIDGSQQQLDSSLAQAGQPGRNNVQGGGSLRRKAQSKSRGGFLIHDSFSGDRPHATQGSVRGSLPFNNKASQAPRTPQSSRVNNRPSLHPKQHSAASVRDKSSISPRSVGSRGDGSAQKHSSYREVEELSPVPQNSADAVGDTDSTHIVQMALNLSESRRIASRRSVSRNTPPRLGPLPDGSSGSNLRQHFQQQRKSSYSSGPRLQHAQSPRLSSGNFESAFEGGGQDGLYRYHFSSSTLARAQKAKDHLELMAQYRRLLDVLPPLKPGLGRGLTTSPPGSPIANTPFKFGLGDKAPLGRHYNPLQYIRNRKVRARERKVIDGEKQGFGDVDCVKPWVDKVVERATSFAAYPEEDASAMPAFPGVDESSNQIPSDNYSRASTRVRRPRVDWFIEPCDIVADAYWLEQEDHKELIEDRNWRKLFRPTTIMSRPMSRETAVDPLEAIPAFSMQDDDTLDPPISGITKVDTDLSQGSAKYRAKQTLHNIRAYPHRHGGPIHNIHHDMMWHRKDSTSDISGSDNDKKHSRKTSRQENGSGGMIGNAHKSPLETKMLEVGSKDEQDRDITGAFSDPEPIHSPSGIRTPENNSLSQPQSRLHSRKSSLIETSDSDRKRPMDMAYLGSPPRYVPGRQSLDIADRPRESSLDRKTSLPTSPELRPAHGSSDIVLSGSLSPTWSRSGSPARNPLTKIKKIMRDNKSGESGAEQDASLRVGAPDPGSPSETANQPRGRQSSPPRTSESIAPDLAKTHRRNGSTRLRPDDQNPSFRGIFKGPRIDTVIRGSVSKLGDILWRKDGSSESPLDAETTDESESEKAHGRSASSTNVSQPPSKGAVAGLHNQPKHFLDSMPQFNHVQDPNHTHGGSNSQVDLDLPDSANHSRQPSQVDLLRPPHVDPRSTPSLLMPSGQSGKHGDSEISDPDSRHGSVVSGVYNSGGRSNSLLDPAKPEDDGRSFRSRHWSIADKETPTEQTRLTRREIARMRALVLSTGVKAMEINRRAQEAHKPFCPQSLALADRNPNKSCASISWADIARMCPEAAQASCESTYYELYALAGQTLSTAIQNSGRRWQTSADQFTYRTGPQLQNRIGDVRSRIADDLSERCRHAADLADETNRDLALGQPLKVKVVVDTIEKMLRRRRRRLRWIRRALWLTVEWLLVGFMWYVWFVVMILRVFLGVSKGMWNGVRWLLWL